MPTYPAHPGFEHAQIKSGKPTKAFDANFDAAFKQRTNKPGFTRIVYKNGKKTEVTVK